MPNFFIGIAMKKRTLLSVVSLESRLAPAGLPLIPLANVLDVQHVDLLSVYSGGWGLANKDHDANRTLAAAESLLFANAKRYALVEALAVNVGANVEPNVAALVFAEGQLGVRLRRRHGPPRG